MDPSAKIAKNTMFNFMAQAIDYSLAMAQSIFLARALGSELYGTYSYFSWLLTLAVFIVNLGWGMMAKRYIAEAIGQDNKDKAHGLVRLALVGRIIPGILVTIVILAFSSKFVHLFGKGTPIYFTVIACSLVPFALNQMLTAMFIGFQKFEYNLYLVLSTTPLRVATQIAVALLGYGVVTILGMNLLSLVVGSVVGIILIMRLVPPRKFLTAGLNSENRKAAIKFALPAAGFTAVTYLLWEQPEVFFLGRYRPAAETGFYNLAASVTTLVMGIIPMVFASVLLPAISEQFGRKDMDKIKAIYLVSARYLMMMALPLAVILVTLSGSIVGFLYGAQYHSVIGLIRIMSFPWAIYALLGGAGAVIFAINQPGFALKVGLLLGALSVGLNFLVVPRFGVVGAAIASSVAQVLMFPVYIWFVERKIKVVWPLADGLRILLASFPAGVVLYVISQYLGSIQALCLGLPVGVILIIVGLVMFGVIRDEDICRFRRLDKVLPSRLRGTYGVVISVVSRLLEVKQAIWEWAM